MIESESESRVESQRLSHREPDCLYKPIGSQVVVGSFNRLKFFGV